MKTISIRNPVSTATGFDLEIGSITLFYTTAASVPAGWQLCDGTNGTPDMRGMFLYCASIDGDLAGTGGATTHTHTGGGSSSTGSHNHSYSGTWSRNYSSVSIFGSGIATAAVGHGHGTSSGNTSTDDSHSHASGGTTGAGTNLPAYHRIYWIKRLS